MRPLDPRSGPVERFACELRALRAARGDLAFWKMARLCDASKSALAAAVAGQQMPSEWVVSEFVAALKGDGPWWRQRWEQACAEERVRIERGDDPDPQPAMLPAIPWPMVMAPVAAGPPGAPAGRSPLGAPAGAPRWRYEHRSWRTILLLVAVVELVAAALVAGAARMDDHKGSSRVASGVVLTRPADGVDPYMAGCGADQQVVDREGMVWPGESSYGWLTMFHSHRCDASWGSVAGPNSSRWRVVIIAHRPEDNAAAPSSFSGDSARPGSWGNLLFTTTGCVWIEAYVQDGAGRSRSAKTDCYQESGPVLHATVPPAQAPARH